jgi:glycosyltransferase involved in cell wall biosynthesis
MRVPALEPEVRSGITAADQVEVVITCFNDGAHIHEALRGLGADRASGKGVIIVNDGSTEEATVAVLNGLRAQGVRVVDRVNGGVSAARNAGWRASSARYILFLDAHDRVHASLMTKAALLLDEDPSLAMVHSDKEEFGDRQGVVEQGEVGLPQLLVGNRIDACAVVRRSALEEVGGFDERMQDGYEDWELWIGLQANGYGFRRIPEPLFQHRVRIGSPRSRASDPEVRARIVRYVVGKHGDVYREHVRSVVSELQRIQAHDHLVLLRSQEMEAAANAKLDRSIEERERIAQELNGTQAALMDAREQNDLLANGALRLEEEVAKALRALDVHREHGRALQALVGQYEERIRVIEQSRLWRARRAYYKLRALMRTSGSTSTNGFKWMRRITFLVGGKGRRLLRIFLAKALRTLYLWMEVRPVRILTGEDELRAAMVDQRDAYAQWMDKHFARPSDLRGYAEDVGTWGYRPLVSIVMPVYAPPIDLLNAAIRSVLAQVYPHVELCIADDRSPGAEVRACLAEWEAKDPRVKVTYRTENGHISEASNTALALAQGEFVAFMDHDDLLAPDALHHVVKRLNQDRSLDVLYTDEDKVDEQGRHSDPHFKPKWCPDHMLSRNYFGHLVVMRTALVNALSGFRTGFEGSQDYDLFLRATERTERIAHIPRVLYHWRIHAASAAKGEDVKPYAYDAAKRALMEACARRGEPAEVSFLYGFRGYGIRFTAPLKGKVSVIIPTKDKADVLRVCLRSLFALTDHPDMEVTVVSNNSTERSLFDLMKEMEAEHPSRFHWFEHNTPFNFSEIMNEGVRRTNGEHILFLNNDTEIIHAFRYALN